MKIRYTLWSWKPFRFYNYYITEEFMQEHGLTGIGMQSLSDDQRAAFAKLKPAGLELPDITPHMPTLMFLK